MKMLKKIIFNLFNIILTCSLLNNVSVNAIEISESLPCNDIFYTDDIAVFKSEGMDDTLCFTNSRKIVKIEKTPETAGELTNLSMKYNTFNFWISNEEENYIAKIIIDYQTADKIPKLVKTDIEPKISYVFDMSDYKVMDYETGNLIYDFSKNKMIRTISENRTMGVYNLIGNYFVDPERYSTIQFGDINADNSVDISDLTLLSLELLGDYEFKRYQIVLSDFNEDQSIDLTDLARLKQYVAKRITSL